MRRLLGFGTYDRDQHPRVGVLLDGLRANGWEVAELDRPLGLSTSERVELLRKPWLLGKLAMRLTNRWAQLVVGSLGFRGRNAPDAVLVGYLGHFDVLLARMLFPRTTIVLDHLIFAAGTAQDRGESGGMKLALLRVLDRLATGAADVIVVDTAEHGERLAPALGERRVVVPVGAPSTWFDVAPARGGDADREPTAPLSVVFYGLFTPLQGTPTIARALRRLHDQEAPVRATLIGKGQDLAECREILAGVDTVTWEDWVPAAELPAVVAEHDVCLGIVGTTAKAQDVVPNKVYQGIAAGCAVITSDTAPQRRVLEDAAVLVPAGDDEALAAALSRLAQDPSALEDARAASSRGGDRFHPEAVVAPLLDRLDEVTVR
jgi:glycosyltransferase involved in cell wall biosynthesis